MNRESFYIELKPTLDKENVWTGELAVNIITDKENPMEKQSMLHLAHLTNLVACCVAYIDEHSEFLEVIENYLVDNEDDEDYLENSVTKVEYTDGNIIKLSFGTNTKGSA
tara:strand:- start:188 stop:517 length:330 start_codon:yes stop_codon:yes gene_type:complete